MDIELSPMRMDETLFLHKLGDSIVVNDKVYDFAALKEGDLINPEAMPGSIWFAGPVGRRNNDIFLCIRLPNPADYTQEQAFPDPLLNVQDGPVSLPGYSVRELPLSGLQAGLIEWSMVSKKSDRDREAAIPVELAWQAEEMLVVANQLLALEEEAEDALPGDRKAWLQYRTKVRLWHESPDFPGQEKRPARPS